MQKLTQREHCLTAAFILVLMVFPASMVVAGQRGLEVGGFVVEQEVTVKGTPNVVYDTFTGDIKPWWDHTMSEDPVELRIDAFPGGHFYELFDRNGNGAIHATVIYADRGKMLKFEGPLGFNGKGLRMVHTFTFERAGDDRTRIKVEVHGTGELEEGWAGAVEQVWHHFLTEAFKPYMDSRPAKPRSRRN
jgi:hypothetical protein